MCEHSSAIKPYMQFLKVQLDLKSKDVTKMVKEVIKVALEEGKEAGHREWVLIGQIFGHW